MQRAPRSLLASSQTPDVSKRAIMQVAATSSALAVPCASTRLAGSRSSLGSTAGLTPVFRTRNSRAAVTVRAEKSQVSRSTWMAAQLYLL